MSPSHEPSSTISCLSAGLQSAKQHSLLKLSSIPKEGMTITHLDLDLTVSCNLRCHYCFKEKSPRHMDVKTAFDAIVWLIHASGDAREISLAFIGGEPLLKFDTIKKLVPFAVRRAIQHGKRLRMSMTTNCTIMNREIYGFFKKWGIGFHTSIDGHAGVQDAHRVYRNGRGSSKVLSRNIPQILKIWPNATARSTVIPDTACEVFRSYKYFLKLGYFEVAFVPGDIEAWTDATIESFRGEFERIGEDLIKKFRANHFIQVKWIHDIFEARSGCRESPPRAACGAGRGMALVDVDGGLWPCHRWNQERFTALWRQGSIYESVFRDEVRRPFKSPQSPITGDISCESCPARPICNGGCPAENVELTGKINEPHSNFCRLTAMLAQVGEHVHDTLMKEKNSLLKKRYYDRAAEKNERRIEQ